MQENKSSNYDKLSEEWRLKFLEMDKELVKKKLPEIRQENDIFLITHFGEQYGVSLKDGTIFLVNQRERPVSNGVKMDIYNLFRYPNQDMFREQFRRLNFSINSSMTYDFPVRYLIVYLLYTRLQYRHKR